jgi:hypothetical protein
VKIAITFLTCDRVEYTRRTLETLAAHNDLSQFILLHGDDASTDDAGGKLARSIGFMTIAQSRSKRAGVCKMTADLFAAAKSYGADFVINLQNDWESWRPIPVGDFETIFADPQVYCLRLYGAMKSVSGRCGLHHGGREPRKLVEWRELSPGYQIGDIHWGHPPAVTRIGHAIKLTRGAIRESVSRKRSGQLTDLTVRVVENVFGHIGRERTPGFVA